VSNVTIEPIDSPELFVVPSETPGFVDRRKAREAVGGIERRQFGNTYRNLSDAGRELAESIDAYKVEHRRRYITPDEMLDVITALGYRKAGKA
jgi:hypothetical protein